MANEIESNKTEKIENNKSLGKEYKCSCVNCSGKTTHTVLQSVDVTGFEWYAGAHHAFGYECKYQIIQCLGCQKISFREASTNSEDVDRVWDTSCGEWTGAYLIDEKLYPSRIENRKSLGDEIYFLPSPVQKIYKETLQAMASQSPILTGIGLRALVETICKERHAKGKALAQKIDDLVVKQLLTPSGRDLLHKIRTLGNDAAHEAKPHTEKQLGVAMDVVENLLRDVYILPKQMQTEFT